jgi:hypothetical protein
VVASSRRVWLTAAMRILEAAVSALGDELAYRLDEVDGGA